jgi:hypothetical protein
MVSASDPTEQAPEQQVMALDTAVWASNRQFTAANVAVSLLLDQQSATGDEDGGDEDVPKLNLFERQLEELLNLAANYEAGEEITPTMDEGTSRLPLSAGGRLFDIILAQAIENHCLNCWSDYVWVIGSVPG